MSSIYSSSYSMKQLFPFETETITVSFHPHPLQLKHAHETPYYCIGCKEKGLGKYYQCEQRAENCDCHLHQKCVELSESGYSSSIKFTFLESKKCDFVFEKESRVNVGGLRGCDACGKAVKGWFYKCKICKKPHYLHPCCAHLPIKKEGKNGIVLYLKAKTKSSTCQECKMENINVALGVRGWFYVSNCGKHCYHVGCVMDMAIQNLSHNDDNDDNDDDDDGCVIEETSNTDDGRKSGSCESLRKGESRAIRKLSRKVGKMKFLTEAAKFVINLIISAIFGIPLTDACVAFYHLF